MPGSRGQRRWWGLWPLIGTLFAVPFHVIAQESCLKQVFERYCLGGDVNLLLRQGRQPEYKRAEGDRLAFIFQEGPERIYVLAFRGRIYKILRSYRGATQLRYEDLYASLRSKYGPGEDHSSFPPYAKTASRKLGSIRRGDGRAVHDWKTDEGWYIELSWTREMGLALAYIAKDLNDEQKAAAELGL